jgi:hypothetical protein
MFHYVLCINSKGMSSPCVGDMEYPQGDSAVSGVVIWLIKSDHWYLSRYYMSTAFFMKYMDDR